MEEWFPAVVVTSHGVVVGMDLGRLATVFTSYEAPTILPTSALPHLLSIHPCRYLPVQAKSHTPWFVVPCLYPVVHVGKDLPVLTCPYI